MSASKAVASAKMRGGGTRPTGASSKTATFSNNNEVITENNLVQVTPIQMLKIHESRITSIESLNKTRSLDPPKMDTIYEEQSDLKKTLKELEKSFQEMKTTIVTLQTSVLSSSQTIIKLRDEVDELKKK